MTGEERLRILGCEEIYLAGTNGVKRKLIVTEEEINEICTMPLDIARWSEDARMVLRKARSRVLKGKSFTYRLHYYKRLLKARKYRGLMIFRRMQCPEKQKI